jgi:PAS domain-containing protein
VSAALEEAVAICTQLLQDLAGADMEIQRRIAEARVERQHGDYLFERMLTPCLCADDNGRITRANRAAALLLNVSARHLVDQPLLHFTQDRDGFLHLLHNMRRDRTQVQCALTIRPRERGTIKVVASVMPRTVEDASEWLWFMAPEPAGQAAGFSPRPRRLTMSSVAIDGAAPTSAQVSS